MNKARIRVSGGGLRNWTNADQCHWAWVKSTGGGQRVVIDDVVGPAFEMVENLEFHPKGGRSAYKAKCGSKWCFVVDGVVGNAYDEILQKSPSFSPDGLHFAYGARQGSDTIVVWDDKEYKIPGKLQMGGWVTICSRPWRGRHDGERWPLLYFSPNSRHLVWAMENGNAKTLVVDGEPVCASADIREWVFSPDGSRLAYTLKRNGKQWVVVDDEDGPLYDSVTRPQFSPDGKRIAYWATRGGRSVVVLDGRESREYEHGVHHGPFFSPDSRHHVYIAQKDQQSWVVVDSREQGPYEEVLCNPLPVYSPDSSKLVYGISRNKKQLVIINGRDSDEFDSVRGLIMFPAKGKSVAFQAWQNGKHCFVLDGVRSSDYDDIEYLCPVEVRNDSPLAYAARKGSSSFFVVSGCEGPQFPAVNSLSFRSREDGKHFAYLAKKWFRDVLVLDNEVEFL